MTESTDNAKTSLLISHPTIDETPDAEELSITYPNNFQQVYSDDLANFLIEHNAHKELYQILHKNNIEVTNLQRDIKLDDMDNFCSEYGLTLKQKLRMKALMRKIEKQRYQSEKADQDLQRRASLIPTDKMTVILIGDIGSGKTSLMRRYCLGAFSDRIASTAGPAEMKNVEILSDNTVMEVTIWDTAGQELYQSICQKYYKRGDCVIICYDLTNQNAFRNITNWRKAIEEHAKDGVVVVIVGCKNDSVTNSELIELSEKNIATANRLSQDDEWNAMCCECSAKTPDNVRGVFKMTAELVLKRRGENVEFAEMKIDNPMQRQRSSDVKQNRIRLQRLEENPCHPASGCWLHENC